MSDDLATFLRARLDELWLTAERYAAMPRDMGESMKDLGAYVLADIDTKRRIIDLHEQLADGDCFVCYPVSGPPMKLFVEGQTITARVDPRSKEPWPCPTLRLLALPWRSHPDYRQEWTV